LITELCSPQLQAPDAGVWLRLLLLSPVLEECVFRAGLQEWLMRRRTPSVLLSSIAFALLHLGSGWPQALAVAPPGVALALLYRRTRSWCWCALAHGAMNAFAISVCGL
jgi:membrane protease YdiL (CAAX protease family)